MKTGYRRLELPKYDRDFFFRQDSYCSVKQLPSIDLLSRRSSDVHVAGQVARVPCEPGPRGGLPVVRLPMMIGDVHTEVDAFHTKIPLPLFDLYAAV